MANTIKLTPAPVAVEVITSRIVVVRGQKVILDADLAALYEVPTKRFNEAVKRNLAKFPADFMFALTADEWEPLRSQFATSNTGRGGRRYLPYAFTEHGALMASMILSSPRAIEVSVYVVRAFVQLREVLATHKDLAAKLATLERQTQALSLKHDSLAQNTRLQLKQVFEAIHELMAPPEPIKKRRIGFVSDDDR